MKIVLANYRYYVSGGPEIYMFNVKKLLEDAGHTVIPYSVRSPLNEGTPYASYFPHGKSESGDAYFNDVKKSPSNVIRLLSCAFYNREAYRNLRRLIRDESPDVVYVLQQINALSPSIFKACHDEGVRVVHRLSDFNMMCPRSDFLCDGEACTSCIHGDYRKALARCCCHGSKATTLVRVASMKFHQFRRLFSYVDAYVCPSVFTARLLEASGVPHKKISVIPTPVICSGDAGFASTGEHTAPSSSYVLYLGRISPEKGIDYLVKAVEENPSLRLIVTGKIEGDYAAQLKRRVEQGPASGRVEFSGFVSGEEKAGLIQGASCVACPSVWYENLPNAVLEAYAYGKPVVAFDIGCMPEIVRDGETGYVVPLGSVAVLAERLSRLQRDSNLALGLGASARQLSRRLYSPEAHLAKLLEVLGEDR